MKTTAGTEKTWAQGPPAARRNRQRTLQKCSRTSETWTGDLKNRSGWRPPKRCRWSCWMASPSWPRSTQRWAVSGKQSATARCHAWHSCAATSSCWTESESDGCVCCAGRSSRSFSSPSSKPCEVRLRLLTFYDWASTNVNNNRSLKKRVPSINHQRAG